METRTVLTQYGQYEMASWDGTNGSGLKPLCDKVLVLCDQPVGKTTGGIIIVDTIKENTGFAATSGVIVAIGDQAFAYDSDRLVHWEGERPKAGDRVVFVKYAGLEYTGRDGLLYRLMQDKSLGAIELPVEDE